MGVGASIAMEASSKNLSDLVEQTQENGHCEKGRQRVSRRRDSRDEEIAPVMFFDLIKQGAQLSRDVKESIHIYGRIERCVINQEGVKEVPLRLTYRPHRHALWTLHALLWPVLTHCPVLRNVRLCEVCWKLFRWTQILSGDG
jgi:hypothetical protein